MKDFKAKTVCDHIVNSTRYTLSNCPRCKSNGFYFDLSFDEHGKLKTVEREEKLQQSLLKIFTEPKRYSGYGFRLKNLLGALGGEFQKARIKGEVVNAINYLYFLQQKAKNQGKVLKLSEEIAKIGDVEVLQNDIDPRVWHILVKVITAAGKESQISYTAGQSSKFASGMITTGRSGTYS